MNSPRFTQHWTVTQATRLAATYKDTFNSFNQSSSVAVSQHIYAELKQRCGGNASHEHCLAVVALVHLPSAAHKAISSSVLIYSMSKDQLPRDTKYKLVYVVKSQTHHSVHARAHTQEHINARYLHERDNNRMEVYWVLLGRKDFSEPSIMNNCNLRPISAEIGLKGRRCFFLWSEEMVWRAPQAIRP